MIQDVTINQRFIVQLDHLIGKSTEYKADEAPISTDGLFTRNYSSNKTKLSRFSFWTKEKVGSFSKATVAIQIKDFIQSEAFLTNWQHLPIEEQNKKIQQLEKAISSFKNKVISRLNHLEEELVKYRQLPLYLRLFASKPSSTKIESYKEAERSLDSSLETLESFAKAVHLKLAATKYVSRKLYKGGILLPRLLGEDLMFQKHPKFITFCSQYESSTAPFIAMMRDMESQGIVGRFNAAGLRTHLKDLHNKEDLALGAINPKEIQDFNKMCLSFIEEEYGKEARREIENEEGYQPYKKGEKVISGQLFHHFIQKLTPKEVVKEEPVEEVAVVETPPPSIDAPAPQKGMFSRLKEMTIPDFFGKRRKNREEGSPQSVASLEKSSPLFSGEFFKRFELFPA